MAITPHEKAKPAMTVVVSASSLTTRQPAQAHAGAWSRKVARTATKNFTTIKLTSDAAHGKSPVGSAGPAERCLSESVRTAGPPVPTDRWLRQLPAPAADSPCP
jgi:hypothetical protein